MAFIISVPPLPCRVSMNRSARCRFSSVLARGFGAMTAVSPAKVIRLKRSAGRRFSIARRIMAFEVSMGKPLIEPLVSSTNTNSRGTNWSCFTRAGGCSTSVKNFPRSSVWVSTASVICSPAVR